MKDIAELRIRYNRQISIAEIGIQGQIKLLNSKVLIVGCGALGSMVAMELAGAGVGTIGISDFDTIEISNLQRQFFFKTEEAGKKKCETLRKRIKELNPATEVKTYEYLITGKNAYEIFKEYDFIIDSTDNPSSKMTIGEICSQQNKSCCIAGVSNFRGQVMTFKGKDSRFEEYFGTVEEGGFLPCSSGGVGGPAAAFCASLQAAEAIKDLIGIGENLNGKILIFNLLYNDFRIYEID